MYLRRPFGALFWVGMAGLLINGCSKGPGRTGGAGQTRIPECGFSMNLPSGWTTEQYAETEFYRRGDRDNCWGMAKFCPRGTFDRRFSTVAEFANYLVEEDRFEGSLAQVLSRQ